MAFSLSLMRYPWLVLLAVAGVSLSALHAILDLRTGEAHLKLDTSVDAMLPLNDEGQIFYQHVRRLFGSDEQVIVALHHPEGIFRPDTIAALQRMTERITRIDGVHHVVSLANALDMRNVEGDLVLEPFLGEAKLSQAELLDVRRSVDANPIYGGALLSRDGKTTALMVTFLDIPERDFIRRGIGEAVRRAADEERGDAEAWVTGSLLVKAETTRVLLADLSKIVPLVVIVLAAVSLFTFRSLRGAIVPLATISLSLLWTLALVSLSGLPLNLVTVVVPPVVLVVGFAYAIHVVTEYEERRRECGDAREAADRALGGVALPVFLTAATTAAGFLSLTTSRIGAIQEFGVFAALGVACSAVASLVFAPAALQVWPAIHGRTSSRPLLWLEDVMEALADFDIRRRTWILLAGLLVGAISVVAMTRIQVSNDFINTFPANARVRTDFEAINSHLEGAGSLMVVIETDYPEAFIEPLHLREMETLQTWLEAQPEIGGTTSLVDYVKLIHRGFRYNDPAQQIIPDSKRLISQLLFFAGSDDLESFVDSRYQTAAILVRTSAVSSREAKPLLERIHRRLEELPSHLEARVTGNTVLVSRTLDDIAWGQATSLASAFLVIYAILALLFTSFRIGLLALIPNILPVAVYFGILGLTGISLNPTTGLVACLVLGIAVDDTIHFLSRFNTEAKKRASEKEGLVFALRTVGVPVTSTSVALCLGFLVMTVAQRSSQAEFGALAAATLAVAWLADVTFTPALAARMRIVTLWEMLTLDLGEAPNETIPFFHGLSKTQARLVALLTSLRTYPAGHRLFSIGDEGNSLVVVIDGRLEVTVPGDRGLIRLAEQKRGDVIGEVAVFEGKRTAHVEALTDVRLLELGKDDLARVKRRYPRISAQLYRNLSEILASRLARLTQQMREN